MQKIVVTKLEVLTVCAFTYLYHSDQVLEVIIQS